MESTNPCSLSFLSHVHIDYNPGQRTVPNPNLNPPSQPSKMLDYQYHDKHDEPETVHITSWSCGEEG